MEPTKHQYDHDVATVYGFLARHGLLGEVCVNVEANHATLAGHSFEHEIATAVALGLLGGIDMNRGDPQNGWDTDQFPNNAQDLSLAMLEIVRAGGLGTGGFNFDAKLRPQSIDPADLLHARAGGLDAMARALLTAERIAADGALDRARGPSATRDGTQRSGRRSCAGRRAWTRSPPTPRTRRRRRSAAGRKRWRTWPRGSLGSRSCVAQGARCHDGSARRAAAYLWSFGGKGQIHLARGSHGSQAARPRLVLGYRH